MSPTSREVKRRSYFRSSKKHPRVAVFCRCGAAWFGHYAVDNPRIADHRRRCGDPITRDEYIALGHRLREPTWWSRVGTH
jgi:hypothetical protein